nr:MAG TPA: hypothetical protein [Caudoviricetes sp.]
MYHLSIHKPFILAVFPVSHPINPYTKEYTPHMPAIQQKSIPSTK